MKEINLLLIDDQPIFLEALASLLSNDPNLKVLGKAKNAASALHLFGTMAVDIAIVDIELPDMDGMELSKIIRRNYPKTKIIILSVHDDWNRISIAYRLGLRGYVDKFKTKETLIAAIYAVNAGHHYFPIAPDEVPEAQPEPVEPSVLTKREKEILCLLVSNPGLTAKEVGERLFIGHLAVETHLRNIRRKLGFHKTAEAIKYAIDNQLCPK